MNLYVVEISSRYVFVFLRLSNVVLESAEETEEEVAESEAVPSVEFCECPPGYHGSSCENCDIGYFKVLDFHH